MQYFSKGLAVGFLSVGLTLAPSLSLALESETAPNDNDVKSGPMSPLHGAVDKPGDNTAVDPATLPGNLEAKNTTVEDRFEGPEGKSGESVPPPKTKP